MVSETGCTSPDALNAREYYYRLIDFITFAIDRTPQLSAELSTFAQYVAILQSVSPYLNQIPQAERIQAVHWEIERMVFPNLPVILPQPHQRITIGAHMDITTGFAADTCWPDESIQKLRLYDGITAEPSDSIGRIDIYRDFARLASDTNLIEFIRELTTTSVTSFRDLAYLCEAGDHRLKGIQVFAGVSHLARVAGKFGFSVYEIVEPQKRTEATDVSRALSQNISVGNRSWQTLRDNYRPAHVAYISRQLLINNFGSQAQSKLRGYQRR